MKKIVDIYPAEFFAENEGTSLDGKLAEMGIEYTMLGLNLGRGCWVIECVPPENPPAWFHIKNAEE